MRTLPSLKDYLFLTLDRADIREQAQRDPHALLRSAPQVIIDEVQRDPALVLAIVEQTTADDRALWFQGYIETYLDRDLRDLASLNNPLDMRRLMRISLDSSSTARRGPTRLASRRRRPSAISIYWSNRINSFALRCTPSIVASV